MVVRLGEEEYKEGGEDRGGKEEELEEEKG